MVCVWLKCVVEDVWLELVEMVGFVVLYYVYYFLVCVYYEWVVLY